jgi:hypothetical protein
MAMPTIFKSEVGHILVALSRSAERATAAGVLNPGSEYVKGYMAALEAVGLSLGLSEALYPATTSRSWSPRSLEGDGLRLRERNG